ncbi:roadblock/LC7 domain-containing protein [Streptomyces sp. NPDC051664]|uniref:roadblock/LC7 domain-containing protein n=1 Tax=Streptomyces sp. NPDC051664 TaxID=3365668 RepID=UPI0037A57ACE
MTQSQETSGDGNLGWLLMDMVQRVAEISHAILLTTDGLLLATSDGLSRGKAERLAAVASGLHSLAKGVGWHFDGGPVRQTIVEMEAGLLFVCTAGENSVLAALTPVGSDTGVAAFEMTMLANRLGYHMSVDPRAPQAHRSVT